MRKLRSLVGLVIIGASLLSVMIAPGVSAARSTYCDESTPPRSLGGRDECYGYFTGVDGYNGGIYLDDVIAGGIPNYVDTASELTTFYYDKLYSGSAVDQMGAAFVILTMMGVDGPSAGGSVSAGINTARSYFSSWEELVLAYGAATDAGNGYGISFLSSVSMPAGYANSARLKNNTDIVYHKKGAETIMTVAFYTPDAVVARIQRTCSNMIGDASLPEPPAKTWKITGESSVSTPTAFPGASVNFSHRLNNSGPDVADGVWWTINDQDNAAVVSNGKKLATTSSISLPVGWSQINTNTFTIPPTATAGQKFCQYIGFEPGGSNPSISGGQSTPACVTVVYDYELTPVVTAPVTMPVGSTTNFSYAVNNAGPTITNTTNLIIREIVIPLGATFPKPIDAINQDVDCPHYLSGASVGVTCNDIAAPAPRIFSLGNTPISVSLPVSAVGRQAGDRVCRALSVRSRDETAMLGSYPWHNRDFLGCTIITKSPYIAIAGGDASAGGSTTSPCTGDGKIIGKMSPTFGSFGEYGLIATKDVTNVASAGILAPIANLTFANTPSYGSYSSAHCINDYVALYAGRVPAATSPTFSSGSIPSASGDVSYQVSGDVTINASTVKKGQHIVIYAPGRTVTIAGNISYDVSGYKTFSEAPSLVVIADKIYVQANVTQIDGVYYAGGTNGIVNTCVEATNNPNSGNKDKISANGVCKERLIVNGAVIAKKLHNLRTKGGTDATMPAEAYSMRPESFLTPYARSLSSPNMTVQFSKELPPRY